MFLYYRIDLLIIILASDRSLEVLLKASLSAMGNLGLSFMLCVGVVYFTDLILHQFLHVLGLIMYWLSNDNGSSEMRQLQQLSSFHILVLLHTSGLQGQSNFETCLLFYLLVTQYPQVVYQIYF